jgi:hypothetical protein
MNGQQKDASFSGPAKAGLKEMDQRHVNFTQTYSFNFQRGSLAVKATSKQLKTDQPQISRISVDQEFSRECTLNTQIMFACPAITKIDVWFPCYRSKLLYLNQFFGSFPIAQFNLKQEPRLQ